MRTILAAALLALSTGVASAQVYFPFHPQRCLPTEVHSSTLENSYGETSIRSAAINFNGVDYLWQEWENPETGSWTITLTRGPFTCTIRGSEGPSGRVPLDEAMEYHMNFVMGQAL